MRGLKKVYMGIGWGLGFRDWDLGFFFFFIIGFRWTGSFEHDPFATTIYDSLLLTQLGITANAHFE
jgi:hypothetical protein